MSKWITDKNFAEYIMVGDRNIYIVRQYFRLDMQWVIELDYGNNKKSFRIPAMFSSARKAKKICELIEQ
jgi:hypothetical protein